MKKMLIALLAAASLQATAQTEGNDTSFPNVVTDSVIQMKHRIPLTLLHFQQNKLHNYTIFNYITINKSFTPFQKLIQTTLKLH